MQFLQLDWNTRKIMLDKREIYAIINKFRQELNIWGNSRVAKGDRL